MVLPWKARSAETMPVRPVATRASLSAPSTASVPELARNVRELGIGEVIGRTLAIVGDGPVFLTVDVDVLDPAFAPGTGTPEPGGMSTIDLLRATRELAAGLDLVGMDVVEVIPVAVGSADVTALVADRIVREALTGTALRRRDANGMLTGG